MCDFADCPQKVDMYTTEGRMQALYSFSVSPNFILLSLFMKGHRIYMCICILSRYWFLSELQARIWSKRTPEIDKVRDLMLVFQSIS